jgi:hypothetical protein
MCNAFSPSTDGILSGLSVELAVSVDVSLFTYPLSSNSLYSKSRVDLNKNHCSEVEGSAYTCTATLTFLIIRTN